MGTVPRDKAHSRLVCKKCNAIFHMNATGRAVLGEPPADLAAHMQKSDGHRHPEAKPAAEPIPLTAGHRSQESPRNRGRRVRLLEPATDLRPDLGAP